MWLMTTRIRVSTASDMSRLELLGHRCENHSRSAWVDVAINASDLVVANGSSDSVALGPPFTPTALAILPIRI